MNTPSTDSSKLGWKERLHTLANTPLSTLKLRRLFFLYWLRVCNFCRHDRKTKLYCVFIAVLVFLFIQHQQGEKTFSVEVIPSFDSKQNRAISEVSPQTVDITVRGPKEAINNFHNTEKVKVHVKAGRSEFLSNQTLKISRWDVKNITERSLSVTAIVPNRITVSFDEEITRDFVVEKPRTINSPLLRDYSATINIETNRITARGPKSVLDKISNSIVFKTEPIDLRGKSVSFNTVVRVRDLPYTDRVKWERTDVIAHVSLSDISVSNSFSSIPLLLAAKSGDGRRYVSDPETVTVWVRGSESDVQQITPEDIIAIAGCADIPDGEEGREMPVNVALHSGNHDCTLSVEPSLVRVFIRAEDGSIPSRKEEDPPASTECMESESKAEPAHEEETTEETAQHHPNEPTSSPEAESKPAFEEEDQEPHENPEASNEASPRSDPNEPDQVS